ncbi:MAG: DUF2147 domain-containing protein [Cryomorphaceae bacterium]|nr:MAG: DUF2147 domain-containing protein [Cryomorphaceae bacterium]
MKSVLPITLITFLFSLFAGTAVAQAEADQLTGVWQPSDGRSYIKIEKIGNKFYGKVVWLKEPLDEKGNPRVDENNPDKSLRSTPLKGYRVLKDFVFDEKDQIWKDGTIYDPKNGTTYNCKIELVDENKIEVRGYVGTAVFGRTDVWTRLKKKGE